MRRMFINDSGAVEINLPSTVIHVVPANLKAVIPTYVNGCAFVNVMVCSLVEVEICKVCNDPVAIRRLDNFGELDL